MAEILSCEEEASSFGGVEMAAQLYASARRHLIQARLRCVMAAWEYVMEQRSVSAKATPDAEKRSASVGSGSAKSTDRRRPSTAVAPLVNAPPARPTSRQVFRQLRVEMGFRRATSAPPPTTTTIATPTKPAVDIPSSSTLPPPTTEDDSAFRPPIRIELLKVLVAQRAALLFLRATHFLRCRRKELDRHASAVESAAARRSLGKTFRVWHSLLEKRLRHRAIQLAVLERWHTAVQRGRVAKVAIATFLLRMRKLLSFRRLSLLLRAFSRWSSRLHHRQLSHAAANRHPTTFEPVDDVDLTRAALAKWHRRTVLTAGLRRLLLKRRAVAMRAAFSAWRDKQSQRETQRQVRQATEAVRETRATAMAVREQRLPYHLRSEPLPHRLKAADMVHGATVLCKAWARWRGKMQFRFAGAARHRALLSWCVQRWRARLFAETHTRRSFLKCWSHWRCRFIQRCRADAAVHFRMERLMRRLFTKWNHDATIAQHRRVSVARHVLSKWSTRLAARQLVVASIAVLSRPLPLAMVFAAWRRVAEERKLFRNGVQHLVRRVTNRILRTSFRDWRAVVRQGIAARSIRASVAHLTAQSLLHSAWRQWKRKTGALTTSPPATLPTAAVAASSTLQRRTASSTHKKSRSSSGGGAVAAAAVRLLRRPSSHR